MTTTRTPPALCLNCGELIDAAAPVYDSESVPNAGDASMCFRCGTFMIFTETLERRLPTAEEQALLDADPAIQHIKAVWLANPPPPRAKRGLA